MIKPVRCLLAILVMALWASPALATVGVGVHLALDHHGHPENHHSAAVAELAGAMLHGHNHESAVLPDHDHGVIFDGTPPVLRPTAALSGPLLVRTLPAPSLADRRGLGGLSTSFGSPSARFSVLCSLLL